MSLFKLLNIWSFTLNQLEELATEEKSDVAANDGIANFTVCPGVFKSVGEQVVFVCGSLSGLLCIIQVPEEKQSQLSSGNSSRQLLAVKKLNTPIIDLKCGYYLSTVKQSIAALSFEELIIFQVKKNRPNLMTGGTNDEQYNMLEDVSLSHEFEEVCKFSLRSTEIATGIRVSSQNLFCDQGAIGEQNVEGRKEPSQNSSLILPQRDYLVVQYTNQFIFTLINHKKIIAHYEICYPQRLIDSSNDNNMEEEQQLSNLLGAQAMALFHDTGTSYLAVAMSNNHLYNMSLNKLIGLSKDIVMKKVVDSLLSASSFEEPKVGQLSSLAYHNTSSIGVTTLDLDDHSDWQLELTASALEMQSVSLKNSSSIQLIVMSRYSIDVYSKLGEHLLSYRSEIPLICMTSYSTNDLASSEKPKVIVLICSDYMSEERCNLLILEDGMKVWSSLICQKPSHIWRTKLTHIPGSITTLATRDSCLSFGYLGTDPGDLSDYSENETEEKDFTELDTLTGNLIDKECGGKFSRSFQRLKLDICLQASNKWPEVKVDTQITIKPDSKSKGVLQDVVTILEYDDLLSFIPSDDTKTKTSKINERAIQVLLGTFWTDGGEPLSLTGSFSIKPVIFIKSEHAFPKSLEIKVTIKFSLHKNEVLVQNEVFLLPITLIANLGCIECITEDQLLDERDDHFMGNESPKKSNYISIMTVSSESKLIEFIDKLVESDLICRGFNIEAIGSELRETNIRKENYATTMENLTLLSQSLDCRLRYKSFNSTTPTPRQNSEDSSKLVAVKIGIEFSKSSMFPDLELNTSSENDLMVWLNIFEVPIGASQDKIKKHLKKYGLSDKTLQSMIAGDKVTLIIEIESNNPFTLLIVEQHLLSRAKSVSTLSNLNTDSDTKLIGLKREKVLVSINAVLYNFIERLHQDYETKISSQYDKMKEELNTYFHKFRLTSKAILSFSKRLPDLPESSCQEFEVLTSMNRKYHLNLQEILSRLDSLAKLDKQYNKIPDLESFRLMGEDEDCRKCFTLVPLIN